MGVRIRDTAAPATPEAFPVPYSLVSAATLGFDLVRLPEGGDVADVLLTALAADAAGLRALAAVPPVQGRDREQRGVLAVRGPRARELAVAVPHVRDAARQVQAAGDAGAAPRPIAPPSWWRSSSAAPSGTPRPSSACCATTSSARSTPRWPSWTRTRPRPPPACSPTPRSGTGRPRCCPAGPPRARRRRSPARAAVPGAPDLGPAAASPLRAVR